MGRKLLYLIPLVIYLVFTFWYTDLKGPLSQEEIDHYVSLFEEQGRPAEQIERLRQFMEEDTGRQFLMLNNIDMAENPPDVEGAAPGESASQLMGRYMEHMYPALFQRASHPIYFGQAVFYSMDIVGIENAETWDQAALMRYRSRRDLLDIVTNPAFYGKHEFKTAALTKTIAYPLENTVYFSDPRFLLALIFISFCTVIDLLFVSRRISS